MVKIIPVPVYTGHPYPENLYCKCCLPTKRDPYDKVYPPQQSPKPISLEWEDIEYKPPTY